MKGRQLLRPWVVALACAAGVWPRFVALTEAHKPITSPYTFTEHVQPILREHCRSCHRDGGVAPMPLDTPEQAAPWAESIRLELIAGHMPPWPVEAPRGRFHHANALTARELDTILTWASGGTPAGPVPTAGPAPATGDWPLGTPDLELALAPHSLGAGAQAGQVELAIPLPASAPRWLRAVDLKPGAPEMVRSATITVDAPATTRRGAATGGTRVLGLWVPGEPPVALPHGVGFEVPPGATLVVRVRYRKTWQYEQVSLTDRSVIGLYGATGAPRALQSLQVDAGLGVPSTQAVDGRARLMAVSTDPEAPEAGVSLTVRPPGGPEAELFASRPGGGWARRYWLAEPIVLEPGTTVTARVRPRSDAKAAAGSSGPDGSAARLSLEFVPEP